MANLAASFLDEGEFGHPDDATVRALIGQSLRRSRLSREEIADSLSRALHPHKITHHMLNQWCAPNRESARMPAAFVRAFCSTTSDDSLQRFILGPELARLLKLGEVVARVLPDSLNAIKQLPPSESIPEEPQELLASE